MSEATTLPDLQDALALGLTGSEYELICEKQGRPPNQVELAMYSLLWSEHCAYKHSKKLLRSLPTEGEHVVMGPGENAGAVDLGDGLVCAFKVESHNHPSAVEPFQGAATGVGGILRDIFAIGARPIAVLDSLRFGEPSSNRSRYLLDRAVAGIAHYGNSIGVPTIGGEVYFEPAYEHNCLVNAMALGIGERDKLVRSAAAGVGNVVVLFGASTGRDGIGGASVLASAELGEDDDKRPTVQVGDPFEEKKLMECSLELLERGLVVSLQDLGAAGLTSSASEMASKGEVGIDVDVSKVPLREPGMEPFEIMVSESQERMLCVVEPGDVDRVLALCEKWEVGGAAIGTVTDTGRMRVFDGGDLVGDMPVRALVDDCPLYDLHPQRPVPPMGGGMRYEGGGGETSRQSDAPRGAGDHRGEATPVNGGAGGEGDPVGQASAQETLLALLASPNIASRRPLFEHYDAIVQSRTVRRPEQCDAAVLAIEPLGGRPTSAISSGERSTRDTDRPVPGIAVSIDCNGRRVAADPYTGTVAAVLECASNLACAGAEPLGTTNNLNFGNPEKPHVAWQLTEAVRGLGDACRALAAPIVGGNVSLYNEGPSGAIHPTPVVGMVGRLPDVRRAAPMGFAAARHALGLTEGERVPGRVEDEGMREGHAIALVGPFAPSLAASELAKLRGEPLADWLPAIDVEAVIAAQAAVRAGVRSGVLVSAHDIAEGGLAVALAECCLAGGIGAQVRLDELEDGAEALGGGETLLGDEEALFGECSGAFVVSGEAAALRGLAGTTPVVEIGEIGGDVLKIRWSRARARAYARVPPEIELSLTELATAHGALAELFR